MMPSVRCVIGRERKTVSNTCVEPFLRRPQEFQESRLGRCSIRAPNTVEFAQSVKFTVVLGRSANFLRDNAGRLGAPKGGLSHTRSSHWVPILGSSRSASLTFSGGIALVHPCIKSCMYPGCDNLKSRETRGDGVGRSQLRHTATPGHTLARPALGCGGGELGGVKGRSGRACCPWFLVPSPAYSRSARTRTFSASSAGRCLPAR